MELDCRDPLDVKMYWGGVRFILACSSFSHNSLDQKNNLKIVFVLSLKTVFYVYDVPCNFQSNEDAIK